MSSGVHWPRIALALLVSGAALAQDAPSLATPDDAFRLLPKAFALRDRTLLSQLLAPGEIQAQLAPAADRAGATGLYSAEQVLYMLQEFLRGLTPLAVAVPWDLDGYRSSDGNVICECNGLRARDGRAQGVLHLRGQRDRRVMTQRLYLSLREGADGWRVVELRLLP